MKRLRHRLAVLELVALATSLAIGLSRTPTIHDEAGSAIAASSPRPARHHAAPALSALTAGLDPAALAERELRRPRTEDPTFKVPPGLAPSRCTGALAIARRVALQASPGSAASAHTRVGRARSPPTGCA